MKAKTIATVMLSLFVAVSVVVMVAKELHAPASTGAPIANVPHQVIVYYFHGMMRCDACRRIEAYTKKALDSAFAPALADGRLEWRVVNRDEPAHEHFASDYKLKTQSAVVIADYRYGRQTAWKELESVANLVDDEAAFVSYVQLETRVLLETP